MDSSTPAATAVRNADPHVVAIASRVAECAASASPLRIVGGGTWLDAGRPCDGTPLDIGAYSGIVDYVPGDLTITARAGTTLHELQQATAAHGQWLGLDPSAADGATLGATIATASDGPLAMSIGRVRDLVLGVECVTGRGDIIRAGGRVVKNVAGFDLVRLQTGAWGTLGVITEVSLRLRAQPSVDRTFLLRGDARSSIEARLAPLTDQVLAPLAMELLSPAMAAALDLHDAACVLVRLAGNAELVQSQRATLQAAGDVEEISSEIFDRLARTDTAYEMVARVSYLPTHVTTTWRHVLEHCAAHQYWRPMARASLTRGIVRVAVQMSAAEAPGGDGPAAPSHTHAGSAPINAAQRAFVRGLAMPGAHASWERLPSALWAEVPSAVNDALSATLRRTFDPRHILNRGVLGETVGNAWTWAIRPRPRCPPSTARVRFRTHHWRTPCPVWTPACTAGSVCRRAPPT